jgi:branched-subunit amino acid aminotransferase/4-amino-4-deoxychorismate lyase
LEEAYKANEMIVMGGDKIVPVLNFDNRVISEKCGPVTYSLQEWYEKTNENGTSIKIDPLLL